MLKKLLGIAPKPTNEGAFSPSPVALFMATSSKTNYEKTEFKNVNKNKALKVMMLCTEEQHMKMANGKLFSTGNHPVEMLVPMLHFNNAGFEVAIYTPTGKPVKIEMWAFPDKDENVKTIYEKYKSQFQKPKSLADFVANEMNENANYVSVFIPGGHGAMLGLPTDENVKQLLHWAKDKNLLVLSICHGPAALLAANLKGNKNNFIYKGYKIAAFPDAMDEKTPKFGYMPGEMPWKFGEKLTALGVEIVNSKADKTCHKDRNLITGASPEAANDFGKLAAIEMLNKQH